MYKKIRSHPSPVKVYGNKLVAENIITNNELENSNTGASVSFANSTLFVKS